MFTRAALPSGAEQADTDAFVDVPQPNLASCAGCEEGPGSAHERHARCDEVQALDAVGSRRGYRCKYGTKGGGHEEEEGEEKEKAEEMRRIRRTLRARTGRGTRRE